eukprot:m.55433 g.55433  ORF g.55433 m.55433 type:complete len:522 (-) comp10985_c1_seq1:2323-3888(-)
METVPNRDQFKRGIDESKRSSPTDGVNSTLLSQLSKELDVPSRRSSQSSVTDLESLRAEDRILREKIERSKAERVEDASELQASMLSQLQESRALVSSYQQRADQLALELAKEKTTRETAEIHLASALAESKQLKDELENEMEKNDALTQLHRGAYSQSSDMTGELADAMRQAENAIKERDIAQDRVIELEAEINTYSSQFQQVQLTQKEQELRNQIKTLQEERVIAIKLKMDEEREKWKRQIALLEDELSHQNQNSSRSSIADAQKMKAMQEARMLRAQVAKLRSETHELQAALRDNLKPGSPGSVTSASTYAPNRQGTQALEHAALRIVQLEGENERLRTQVNGLQDRMQGGSGSDADSVIEALKQQLRLERASKHTQSASGGINVMLSKQMQATAYRTAATNLREFVKKAASGQSEPHAAVQALSLSDTQQVETLPQGWEQRMSQEGLEYYVDHNTKTTTWIHPASLQSRERVNLYESPRQSTQILYQQPPTPTIVNNPRNMQAKLNSLRLRNGQSVH